MTLSRRELFAMFRRPAPVVAPASDASGLARADLATASDRAGDRSADRSGDRAGDRSKPPAFSLEDFYARRGAEPGAHALAPFSVRCDRAPVPSTGSAPA